MIFARSAPQPSTTALDFAPDILAIEQRPPAPLPGFVLRTLLVLLAVLIVWACIGQLDIVVSAEGKLVPQTFLKIVQPADSGVIQAILVKEGDSVRAGQVLMRLDTTESGANRAIAAKEVEFRRLQLARVDAELGERAMSRRESNTPLFAEVDAQARGRRQAYMDALSTERAGLEQAEAELEAAHEQAVKLEKVLPSYQEEEKALASLSQAGNVPRMQFVQKQRERITAEQDLSSQKRTVASLESRIEGSRTRLARVASDYRQQLLTERVEAQSALDKAEQELAKQSRRAELTELRAPQDGVVKDVATYTVGAVVNAGSVLASLVPVGDELEAEVMVKNEDVGFVVVGQAVKVKLAAFPFQKYGLIEGKVMRVAADASDATNAQRGAPTPDEERPPTDTYKVTVALSAQQLVRKDQRLTLAPGMRVMAEIKQGERTVLEYLLSPVVKTVSEAGRER